MEDPELSPFGHMSLSDACKRAIDRIVGTANFLQSGSQIDWYSASDPYFGAQLAFDVSGDPATNATGGLATLREVVGSSYAVTLRRSNLRPTANVVIGSAFLDLSVADRNVVLVREGLHVATSLSDVALARELGLGDFGGLPIQDGLTAASLSISGWLGTGCVPMGGR